MMIVMMTNMDADKQHDFESLKDGSASGGEQHSQSSFEFIEAFRFKYEPFFLGLGNICRKSIFFEYK